MPTSLGLATLEGLRSRARAIRRDSQYHTDCGKRVEIGPVSLSDVDEAIFIEFAAEQTQAETGTHRVFTIQRTFTATLIKRADPKCEKGVLCEYLLADGKRALFNYEKAHIDLNDKPFARVAYDSARILPRADGNEFEAVEITGNLLYPEKHGDPYAAR